MSNGFPQFVGIGPYGAANWKGSVATFGDLPSTDNQDGDVRGVLDTERAYQWDETTTSWTLYSGPGLPPGTHASTHENGGSDEPSVAGLSGVLADPQTPAVHKTSHQDGGADEISLAGLSGESVTPQPPKTHKSTHVEGGADEFDENDTVNLGKMKTGLTTERYTKTLTTPSDTPADIDAISVIEDRVVDVEAVVIARKADGSERGVYHLEGVFYRNTGGDVIQQGNTASFLIRRSTSALAVDIVPDTGNQTVDVRVTGLAATTVKWEARIILTNLVGA